MKQLILLFLLCIVTLGFSQEEEKSLSFGDYTQFEISIPLQGNNNRGEVFPDGSTNNNWFIPDGINEIQSKRNRSQLAKILVR